VSSYLKQNIALALSTVSRYCNLRILHVSIQNLQIYKYCQLYRGHFRFLFGHLYIDISPLDSRCLYQLMLTPGGTSVCLQRLPQLPVVYNPSISIEWILYTGRLPVLAWREGNIARSAKYIYIAAGLGNKKISFPFSPHHSSYNTRRLSTKGESAISLMQ
jgi:hypothetical protein